MELIDLTLIWAVIIAVGIIMYVLMDGFDLGVGILFLFAPDDGARDTMMNSVAPVWDGNETWLILGGAGLLKPFAFEPAFADLAVTVAATLLLVAVLRGAKGVARPLGVAMTLAYAGFLTFKVLTDTTGAG